MTADAGEDVEQGERSSLADGSANTVTVEISMVIPQEAGSRSTPRSSTTTLGCLPRGLHVPLQGHFLNHGLCCCIYDSQKLEICQWMDRSIKCGTFA